MQQRTDRLYTAGKITVYTSLIGVLVFAAVFIFNLGDTEIHQAIAQDSATTTVTVLNTPPLWTDNAEELYGSSTSTPTNAGDTVSWTAIATDANGEDYWLLICSNNATPTPNSGYTIADAPDCGVGATRWAVGSTTSGARATVSTTTLSAWAEQNVWYAWICDGNAGTPRCNATSTQGSGTTSSPFVVNHRPTFTAFTDTSPADPGAVVTFYSTSSDPDSYGGQDTVRLFVCSTAAFDTVNDTCSATTLASTTAPGPTSDASATYTIVIPTQDTTYGAYGYVIDGHGFEATGGSQGTNSTLTVNNVAPSVASSSISINGGSDITLSQEAAETTGFTLSFTTSDNNSCDAVGGGAGDEVTSYELSLYRNGTGLVTSSSTTCPVTGPYNPNRCYPSSVSTSVWNLSCTASTTSCSGSTDRTMVWNCTFPLWYVADPTDGTATSTQYSTNDWRAQVEGIDDDYATGSPSESSSGIDVTSFLAFALNTLEIPYGSLEPGQKNDPIVATTTLAATGNVGIDTDVTGESMCTTYTGATPCPNSATSTIPENKQVFATGTVAYAQGTAISSSTAQEIEINVPKSTATSSAATNDAFWGIEVPASITYSGDYTGENTFTVLLGEIGFW